MSDFPFEAVYGALADGPLSVNAIADKLGAWCRPGVMNPNLDASLSWMQHQDRIRFRVEDCGEHPNRYEHSLSTCLLEVVK